MARPRTIDREQLLDVAEAIVSEASIAALTFGSLAKRAGKPKASIQSAFGTREGLIGAMLDRWLAREQARFESELQGAASDRERILAHIRTTSSEPREESRRFAPLMAAVIGNTDETFSASHWYASRIGDLNADTEEARRLRIAFLAAEGAYFLRNLIGLEITDSVWSEIFDDLRDFVDCDGAK